jgi:hypothetical protein
MNPTLSRGDELDAVAMLGGGGSERVQQVETSLARCMGRRTRDIFSLYWT